MKFRYIGNNSNNVATKGAQFIVDIDEKELDRIKTFPYPRTMIAKIVEIPCKSRNYFDMRAGDVQKDFVNPFYEMHNHMFPVFVKAD